MSFALASVWLFALVVLKRRARAFGQPFGLPDLLLFACPKRSRQEKGHPSSAPSARPCAEGSRESVGVFGQAIPGLSKTLAASLRPTLRAIRPPPAAPQGPREERGLLPARSTPEPRSEKREARSEKREAGSGKREAGSGKREARLADAHRVGPGPPRARPSRIPLNTEPQTQSGPGMTRARSTRPAPKRCAGQGSSSGCAAHTRTSASAPFGASKACFGLIHSRRTNQARATAPTLNTVSPGTRIHTSIWMTGCCIRSAERAYQ